MCWYLRGILKRYCHLRCDETSTVLYVNSEDIKRALEYDLEQERNFAYRGLTHDQMVEHIAKFFSRLWLIHPFKEGNTRTTAVFIIKYLRSIGFYVENDLFANNSWYFRNALVRANYRNIVKGVERDMRYIVRFFQNLLLGESNELKNRYMLIDALEEWKEPLVNACPTSLGNQLYTNNVNVQKLVSVIEENKRSIKEILELLNLKSRKNLFEYYVVPTQDNGFVTLLYPNKPRQKYLLTIKGLALLSSSNKKMLKLYIINNYGWQKSKNKSQNETPRPFGVPILFGVLRIQRARELHSLLPIP